MLSSSLSFPVHSSGALLSSIKGFGVENSSIEETITSHHKPYSILVIPKHHLKAKSKAKSCSKDFSFFRLFFFAERSLDQFPPFSSTLLFPALFSRFYSSCPFPPCFLPLFLFRFFSFLFSCVVYALCFPALPLTFIFPLSISLFLFLSFSLSLSLCCAMLCSVGSVLSR